MDHPPKEKLIETDPKFAVLIQVWWAVVWRQFLWLLLVFVAIFITSFVFGVIFGIMGIEKTAAQSIGTVIGVVMGLGGGMWLFFQAFRGVLGKKFSGYKLVFLTPTVGDSAD